MMSSSAAQKRRELMVRMAEIFSNLAAPCRLSNQATAGNAHVAKHARRHYDAVTAIPTKVDIDYYSPWVRRGPRGRRLDRQADDTTHIGDVRTGPVRTADPIRK
jgi:hypothetical protein